MPCDIKIIRCNFNVTDGKYVLKFEIHGGRSFLDYLVNSEEPEAEENRNFVIHISYKSQRFYTQAVQCQCEPSFNEVFMMDVGYFESNSTIMSQVVVK